MIKIRSANLSDSPNLAQVQVNSYRTAYRGMFPDSYLEQFDYEEQTKDWQELIIDRGRDILQVAEAPGGQIIGYILAKPQTDIYPGYNAEIIGIHVNQEYQGRGVGRALLDEVLTLLLEAGIESIMLWTLWANPVRTWYERMRGELIAEKRIMLENYEVVEVVYGWKDISVMLRPYRDDGS